MNAPLRVVTSISASDAIRDFLWLELECGHQEHTERGDRKPRKRARCYGCLSDSEAVAALFAGLIAMAR